MSYTHYDPIFAAKMAYRRYDYIYVVGTGNQYNIFDTFDHVSNVGNRIVDTIDLDDDIIFKGLKDDNFLWSEKEYMRMIVKSRNIDFQIYDQELEKYIYKCDEYGNEYKSKWL